VLYADLAESMREGIIYQSLPLTIRLMLASIGPTAVSGLVSTYLDAEPPEPFGAREAKRFVSFLRSSNLKVRYLSEILEFEEALNAVASGDEACTVEFDCNPQRLFEALEKRSSPGLLPTEHFSVDVSAYCVRVRSQNCEDARPYFLKIPLGEAKSGRGRQSRGERGKVGESEAKSGRARRRRLRPEVPVKALNQVLQDLAINIDRKNSD
jgi:hypothetical protein